MLHSFDRYATGAEMPLPRIYAAASPASRNMTDMTKTVSFSVDSPESISSLSAAIPTDQPCSSTGANPVTFGTPLYSELVEARLSLHHLPLYFIETFQAGLPRHAFTGAHPGVCVSFA